MSRTIVRGLLGGLLLVCVWELTARGLRLPSYTLPAISDILATMWTMRRELAEAGGLSLLEAVLGYTIGCVLGIAVAMVIAVLPWTRRAAMPTLMAVNSVPVAAFSPLVLLWFGIGIASKVVLVALAVGFTVFIAALAGFDRVDRRGIDLLRSFGAGPRHAALAAASADRAAADRGGDAGGHHAGDDRGDRDGDAGRHRRARLDHLPGGRADRFHPGLVLRSSRPRCSASHSSG